MKVLLEAKHTLHTGKGKFAIRLKKALKALGVKVTFEPGSKYDIVLGFGKFLEKHDTKKKIVRLGPCHIDKNEDYKKLNKRKKKAMHSADGVIYQSKFSKKLCRSFMGKPDCPEAVIFNGADPKEFDVEPMKSPFKYNFLASTRVWTPQKRLKQIEKAFLEAGIKNSCLWVCGETKKAHSTRGRGIAGEGWDNVWQIDHMGLVSEKKLASLYKLCNAMIHITYLDACPNSVVEALVAGCPVVCTDQGGTHELVKSGYVMLYDKKYNFKPIDLSKPPRLEFHFPNPDLNRVWRSDSNHLHISTIAKQYLEFFERILNGKS